MLCLAALAVALVVWAVTSNGKPGHGGGGSQAQGPGGGGSHSATPLPSITPGPSTSQTGITTEPGGRGGSGGSGGGSGDQGSAGGSGGSGGAGDGGSAGAGADGGSAAGPGGGSVLAGRELAAGSPLPDCSGPSVRLTLRSVRPIYATGQKPQFTISVANSSGTACKVDLASTSAVLTVDDSDGHQVWASDDCPASSDPFLLEAAAHATAGYQLPWDLAVSAPQCATPSGDTTVTAGSYKARVAVAGLGSAQAAFVIGGS